MVVEIAEGDASLKSHKAIGRDRLDVRKIIEVNEPR